MDKREKRYTITFPDGEKITASAGMLNELAIVYAESAERYGQLGTFALAESANKRFRFISNYLNKKGYFDDL